MIKFNKKTFLHSFLLVCIMSCLSYGGDFRVPQDRNGRYANTIDDAYVRVVNRSYSTAASLLLSGATIEIYGVLTSTLPVGSAYAAVELRSTNTANATSELLVPALRIATETRNTLYVFDPPILCPGGLSVNLSSAGTFVSIFYNFSSTKTKADFYIPIDMDGVASHSDFYGVKVASVANAGGIDDVIGTESLDNSTGERVVQTTRGFLYGMMAGSTAAVGSFIVMKDSASVLGSPDHFLPPLFYNNFNDSSLNSRFTNTVIKFPWPILFQNGLSVENSVDDESIRIFTRPARSLR